MKGKWNLGLLLVAAPLFAAATEGKPSTGMSGGHDHAAMMQGMGKPASWTLYPTLKTRVSGQSRETMQTVVMPQNIVAASIETWSNNLKEDGAHRKLEMKMGGAMLDNAVNGGFHWLSAREEQGNSVRIASAVYYNGERGAKNPIAMFMQLKHELEIIPQPFPREHSRYRANEDWMFIVRFNGQPLGAQTVQMETSNGSMAEFISDAQGVIKVHIPDDFKAEEEMKDGAAHNHGMRRGADFVLEAEYADGDKHYLTAFNSSYGPNAYDQRSLAIGAGFTLLGMLGAVPLLRKRHIHQKSGESDNA